MKQKAILLLAGTIGVAIAASADMVLKNNPDVAGLSVITNAMGSNSFFPDACTNFTMEAWIKPTEYQSRTDVFSPIFSITPTDKSGYSRYIFGLRQHKLSLFQATVTSGDRFPVSSSDIALDTWTHVAAVHTATNVRFYINGTLDATLTGKFLPPVTEYSNSHLTIGGYYSVVSLNGGSYGTARVFQGSLSDVRVWTKARTAEEIVADYEKRLRGNEDNLLLYVPFDDANGTVARDMVSGQRLIAPPTMQFVEDGDLSLAPASAKLIGEGYLASTRTGGNSGASAIVTDVDLVNKADGTGPDFTLETWLRVSQQEANDQWIFSKYAASGNVGWIGLDIRGGTLKPEVIISGSSTVRHTLDAALPTNEWVHLAATRSNGTFAIYTNGTLAASGNCTTTGFNGATAAAPLKLLNAGNNQSFGGDVKEMRIWNVARTAEQIAAYYDKAATGREEGLIGCWSMSEGYGSKIYNKVTGAAQSIAVGGMGLARGSYLVLSGQKQTIETDVKLTTSDFTLEAWVCDDSPTPRLGGNGRGYILSQWQSQTDWVSLCFENANRLKPGIRISSTWFLPADSSIKKGKWFHLAATREGNSVKVYLNGYLSTNGTYTANLGIPTTYLTFGALAGNDGHVGGIREARAWSYARTQAQIQQTMFGGLVGNEEGLVGWWAFDQDASATRVLNRKSNDISKYIPTGAIWCNDGVPLLAMPDLGEASEQAANFGGGWYSVARTGIAVDVGDFTFETWVRPDAYPFDQSYLFAQYKEGESNPGRFMMGFHDSGRFALFIGGTDGSGNDGGWKETDEAIPLGRWTHLAATRQGSTLRLYVDGTLAKTFENYTTLSPWSSAYPHNLTLGSVDGAYAYSSGAYQRNNISRSFAGAMREARVWNYARSSDEIKDTYNRRLDGNEPGLVGYWPLNQQDGTTLVNAKVNGASGTIVAGWESVEPLALKEPKRGLVLFIR